MQPLFTEGLPMSTEKVYLKQVKCCSHKFIKTYTNEWYKIMGSTELPIWHRRKRNVLFFNITEDDLVDHCYHTAPIRNYGLSQLIVMAH